MDPKEQVLDAMSSTKSLCSYEKWLIAKNKAGEPMNAGKIAEVTGLDRKVVDKAMTELKKEELIVSPKRCYWQPK